MSKPIFDDVVFDSAVFGGTNELYDDVVFDNLVFDTGGASAGVSLTSVSTSVSTNSVGVGINVQGTSVSSTTNTGGLLITETVLLSGTSSSFTTGIVSVSSISATNVEVSGVSISSSTGTNLVSIIVGISAVSSTVSLGNESVSGGVSITGAGSSGSVGTAGITTNVAIAGTGSIGSGGTLTNSSSVGISISGNNITGNVISLDPVLTSITIPITNTISTVYTKLGRSNYIPNSTMQGASVGVFPTGWSGIDVSGSGVSVTVSAIGVDSGLDYIDLSITGTAVSTFTYSIKFMQSGSYLPISNSPVMLSVYNTLVSGSYTNLNISNTLTYTNGNNNTLTAKSTNFTNTSGILVDRKTISYSPSNYLNVVASLSIQVIAGQTLSAVVRIAAPQLEYGGSATAYIPTYGTIQTIDIAKIGIGIGGVLSTGTVSNESVSGIVGISGASSSSTAGTITPEASSALNISLTGVISTSSIGTQTIAHNISISGVTATGSIANENPTVTVSINGSSATIIGHTNLLYNNTNAGAVVGIIGSGGAAPNGFIVGTGTTLNREIVGFGTAADGTGYLDYRVSGTNTSGVTQQPWITVLSSTTNLTYRVKPGQSISAQVSGQIIAGSASSFSVAGTIYLQENLAPYTTAAYSTLDGVTRTLTITGNSSLNPFLNLACRIDVPNGATVDATFRISFKQVEYGSTATSLLLNSAGITSDKLASGIGIDASGVTATGSVANESPTTKVTISGTISNSLLGRTNLLYNNTTSGAVIGIIGSGGSFPTGITVNTGTTLTREITGFGTNLDGTGYFDYRISGTNTSGITQYPQVFISHQLGITSTNIKAIAGQTYTLRASSQLIAGSTTGFGSVGILTLQESSTPFAGVNGVADGTDKILTLTVGSTASNVYLLTIGSCTIANGATVDATFRYSFKQLELGNTATPIILTGAGKQSENLPIELNLATSGVSATGTVSSESVNGIVGISGTSTNLTTGTLVPDTASTAGAAITSTTSTGGIATLVPSQSTNVSLTSTTSTLTTASVQPQLTKQVTSNTSTLTTSSVAPGTSANVTSNSSTLSTNTVVPSQVISLTLSGVSTSVVQGNESVSSQISITSTSTNVQAGTISASQIVSTNITGTVSTGSANSFTISGSSVVSVSLTATSSVASVNNLQTSQLVVTNPTAVSSVGIVGNIFRLVNSGLSSTSASATLGSISPSFNLTVSGNTSNVTLASTSQRISINVNGVSSSTAISSILASFGISTVGVSSSTTLGSLAKSISLGISGITINGAPGIVTGSELRNIDISGVSVNSFINSIAAQGSDINLDEIYRTSPTTYITLVDDTLVVTISTTYNVVTNVVSDSIIKSQQVDHYVVRESNDSYITDVEDLLVKYG